MPIGGGVGKVFRVGTQPLNASIWFKGNLLPDCASQRKKDALDQILSGYPRYLWAHAMRPYSLAF